MLNKVFYTNWFIPSRFTAYTIGFVVLVRPSAKGDEGMLQHELTHVKQFWHNPVGPIFSMFNRKLRQKYEVEAYKVQMSYPPYKDEYDRYLSVFSAVLSTKYNLGITFNEAKKLLSE